MVGRFQVRVYNASGRLQFPSHQRHTTTHSNTLLWDLHKTWETWLLTTKLCPTIHNNVIITRILLDHFDLYSQEWSLKAQYHFATVPRLVLSNDSNDSLLSPRVCLGQHSPVVRLLIRHT